MSALGKKVAVVSLGSSCQTSRQIKQNADILSHFTGDMLTPKRLPFDSVICPISRTLQLINSGNRFPRSVDDLVPYRHEGVFYWERHGVYFWHDFRILNRVDVLLTFESTKERYEGFFNSLYDLGKMERIIFLVSNTQNNLESVLGSDFRKEEFVFTSENSRGLMTSIEKRINRECEFLFITYEDRSTSDLVSVPEQRLRSVRIPKDNSEWQGNDEVWRKVLREYFS